MIKTYLTHRFFFLIFLMFTSAFLSAQLVLLCNELTKDGYKDDGGRVDMSYDSQDPNNPGVYITYQCVTKIEKVATGNNGKRPWYYYVHFGPVQPGNDKYVFWPKGSPAPWKTNCASFLGQCSYMTQHMHKGCKIVGCKAGNPANVIRFGNLQQGPVSGTFGRGNTPFKGTLNGTKLRFTYNAGSPGNAELEFSTDFKEIVSGKFWDDYGHKGTWVGYLME